MVGKEVKDVTVTASSAKTARYNAKHLYPAWIPYRVFPVKYNVRMRKRKK